MASVFWCTVLVLWAGPTGPTEAAPGRDDPHQAVDFNRDIRPLLAKHCLACHGRDEGNREGSLRLDDGESATGQADSGETAVNPGDPAGSELMARVTSDDDAVRMPPPDAGALTPSESELLRRWIEQGAPYARHWSFVQPQRPAPPAVKNAQWPRGPIDHFVLRKLESRGLGPNPPADRHAMIRRVSLDLRGLPPTWSEVDAFIADEAHDAYEQLVDRLLEDSAYGERWARVWLDLARYADSRGYGSDPLRPNMWRYRDWVIDALNRNMPFDQFTIEQLAGDLLPEPTLHQQIATAFHRNTMTNTEGGTDDEEFRVEAVKDRVDTTIQVWMGLTMGCAKCHSHKYDPISQQEYYSVFAIFNQTKDADRPDESPTIEAPGESDLAALRMHEEKLEALEQEKRRILREIAAQPPSSSPKVKGQFIRVELPGKSRILSLAEVKVWQGETNLARSGKPTQVSTDYRGAAALAIDGMTNGDYYAAKSTTHTRQQADPWWEVDLGQVHRIDRIVLWNRTDHNLESRLVPLNVKLLGNARETLWETAITDPPMPSRELTPRALTEPEKQRVEVEQKIARLNKSRPKMPTLPVLQELEPDSRRETHVLVKGNFLTKGDTVDPAVLSSFHALPDGARPDRLGLAHWLVDAENPLTARVNVNRLWARIFGTGLVATEEDFGTQGDPPSHPELLDWLATEMVQSGWDTKHLLRLIVTSSTYRQSAKVRLDHLAKDPRNRLLGRGPRVRLEAEMVRDQALSISGLLSRQIGGPSVYPFQPTGLWRAAFNGQRTWPSSTQGDKFRRGLYTFWRRTVPYPSMATFDAPSREICTVRRLRTNTPLQAFVCMNDPVYVEAAQALARRIVREGGEAASQRAAYGLRLCMCRPPSPEQIEPVVKLFESEREHFTRDLAAAEQMATEPLGPLDEHHDVAEIAAWTVVANVLLNMDSILNK